VSQRALDVHTHASIREIDEATWDGLLEPCFAPHMRWAFLDALERTGCVQPEVGWQPAHISLRHEGKVIGLAPAYLKGNSEGEFVFDHSWARFAHESLRLPYFPKLVVAVPFTPATGPRLLIAPGEDAAQLNRAFSLGLRRIVEDSELSGAHVLFPDPGSADRLAETGLLRRHGVQYHWRNDGYRSFDDFLARFSAKRRHQIKRERRELRDRGIEISAVFGADMDSALVDHVYEFYTSTVDKYFYGRRYLNRDFFHEVVKRMPNNVVAVLAHEQGARRPIAGAFNLVSERALYGRYWGAREERPFLHFNVCYYAGIDLCIERGLAHFEPGAGGEHKHSRGFESTVTHSVHYLHDRRLRGAIQQFLEHERGSISEWIENEKPLFKPDGEPETV
jgi:predicted N-acyltransferase